MPPVGFEPTISAGEQPQNYALDLAAFGTGKINVADLIVNWPIPVTARSKAWVCGCSPAGIVGSNPAVSVDACLL
jgi:hypothetical protein